MPGISSEGVVLPPDGSAIVIPLEGGQTQIVLNGKVFFDLTDQAFDAADADSAGSLIQIEPGQWTLVNADPGQHAYTFENSAASTSVSIRLMVDRLVDQYLESPATIRANLRSELHVNPVDAPVTVGPLGLSGSALAVTGLLLLVLTAVTTRSWKARQRVNADVRRTLEAIRKAAQELENGRQGSDELTPASRKRVGQLVETAEQMAQSLIALRAKLKKLGLEKPCSDIGKTGARGIDARVGGSQNRAEGQAAEGGEPSDRAESFAEIVRPLVMDEEALSKGLERIRNTIETLLAASIALESEDGRENQYRAEELVERVDQEIKASIATAREMSRY